jgi:hypothetical protein
MKVEKARKRIEKYLKKGFNGHPSIHFDYFGVSCDTATDVVVTYQVDDKSEPQAQTFATENDVRFDETIQTVLLKIIERTQPVSVTEADEVKQR